MTNKDNSKTAFNISLIVSALYIIITSALHYLYLSSLEQFLTGAMSHAGTDVSTIDYSKAPNPSALLRYLMLPLPSAVINNTGGWAAAGFAAIVVQGIWIGLIAWFYAVRMALGSYAILLAVIIGLLWLATGSFWAAVIIGLPSAVVIVPIVCLVSDGLLRLAHMRNARAAS